jgi:hypothetical protein
MIYEVPVSDELIFKHDSGKLGRIRIEGGVLTTEKIISELGWIVPGEHQWCLEKIAENEFKTIFLSNADLTRLVKIVSVPIDASKGIFLVFEEGSATPVDKFKLDEAWVKVSGCPYKLRCDYLALFAVGSLIGKTTEVDMAYTRKHGVVHMHVLVTSIDQIPDGTDHMYDGEGFGITFEVEGYTKPIINSENLPENVNDADDKPQEEGKQGDNLAANKGSKQKDSQATRSANGSSQDTSAHGIQSVQVGEFLLSSPIQLQPVSEGKEIRTRSRWGDRAEEQEELPSPMAYSAPPNFFARIRWGRVRRC